MSTIVKKSAMKGSLQILTIIALLIAFLPTNVGAFPHHCAILHPHTAVTVHWESDNTTNGDSAHNHNDFHQFFGGDGVTPPPGAPYSAYGVWDCRQFHFDRDGSFSIGHGFINEWLFLGGGRDHIPRYRFSDTQDLDPAHPLCNWPQEAKDAVREAFGQWSAIGPDQALHRVGLDFVEAEVGEDAEIMIYYEPLVDECGRTNPWGAPIKVRFNSTLNWNYGAAGATATPPTIQYHFMTTALHEIGHVVGLGEQDDTDDVMYRDQTNGPEGPCFDSLDPDSLHGARDLYTIEEFEPPGIPPMPGPGKTTVTTATGTGTATIGTTSGSFDGPIGVPPPAIPGKPDLVFPHGFFEFRITGLDPGQSVTIILTLPSDMPIGTQVWKVGPTADNGDDHWYQMTPTGDDDGDNVITFALTDGGLGDDDLTANGTIVDQVGPGYPLGLSGVPVFPSIYIGIGAALGAGLLAYFVRRRLAA